MTFEVKLFKRSITYSKEDGTKQKGTNFYLLVGSEYIPIEVVFFPNDKCEGRDPKFAQRMAVLCAIAEELPPKLTNASAAAHSASSR